MTNFMKSNAVIVLIFAMIAIMMFLSGCQETQKPKQWGTGELSPEWVEMFGDDNLSKLNKAQTDLINKYERHLYGVDQVKDGKKVHNYGLIDLVVDLQGRVKALEAVDPNALEPRIEFLEVRVGEHDCKKAMECPLKDNIEELNGVVGMLMEGPEVIE